MSTWFLMPAVSGSRAILAGSGPVMQAAACNCIPAQALAVTRPASAPVCRATTSPAFRLSSCMSR